MVIKRKLEVGDIAFGVSFDEIKFSEQSEKFLQKFLFVTPSGESFFDCEVVSHEKINETEIYLRLSIKFHWVRRARFRYNWFGVYDIEKLIGVMDSKCKITPEQWELEIVGI